MSDESALPLPVFEKDERVCGNCKLWTPHSVDPEKGWVGPCRLVPHRGMFPPSAPICERFAPRGQPAPPPPPERTRTRAPRNVGPQVIRAAHRTQVDPKTPIDLEGLCMTREELMDLFREAAGDVGTAPLANKWEGGTIRLIPKDPSLQPRDLPIDALLHKVVMIRDRLRTLEAKVNAHPKLTDGERVELQHYVTRCYGSLTTFNVLFKEKADQFVGEKG